MFTSHKQNRANNAAPMLDRLLAGMVGLGPHTRADMRSFAHSVTTQARSLSPTFMQEDGKPAHTQNFIGQVQGQLNRVARWRDAITQTQAEGRDITTAAYMLRVMRLTGDDRFGMLPEATRLLNELGFTEVAIVADMLYGSDCPQIKFDRQTDWLNGRRQVLARNPEPTCEVQIDQRTLDRPRVSMIVSMYNAAEKLPAFLRQVATQSLAVKGQLEVILIDSQSPTDEMGVFKGMVDELNFSVLYFRTPQRETIQQAWNRGIALARSQYLAFWGVDEGGDPPVLEVLADELDADPALDWVQTGGRILEVDMQGNTLKQTYTYDRSSYQHGDLYLDNMLLTYVGAVYRKSLHDRVGYYDASFSASGDTEFKMRAQPHLRAKALPLNLGLYFNYPDERMTEHPRAEIEDCRAFDLFRTSAGVFYSFAHRDVMQMDQQVQRALRYRNASYPHWWTDLEVASLLVDLRDRKPDASPYQFAVQRASVCDLFARYRQLDLSPSLYPLARTGLAATRFMRQVRRRSGKAFQPACWLFNDMRYARYARHWPV